MLSDVQARKMKPTDKPISDGQLPGLYLFPSTVVGNGKRVLRFVSPENHKRRNMGLGTYPTVTIRDARKNAFQLRMKIVDGIDPLEERRRVLEAESKILAVPTFAEAARNFYSIIVPGFRNTKHQNQWLNTLEVFDFPKIGKRRVNELLAQDFASCLKPIWLSKPETASRIKQRCHKVMNWCAARGYIIASPVLVADLLLPRQPGKRERVEHQPAMPWRDIPSLFKNTLCAGPPTKSKIMLEILILTAVRSGEVRNMTWSEIDFDKAVWTIPASRMKANEFHLIPLSPYLISLFKTLREQADEESQNAENIPLIKSGKDRKNEKPKSPSKDIANLVFKSRNGTQIGDMTLRNLLHDNQVPGDSPERFATAHGFRSSFRDWASENGYS